MIWLTAIVFVALLLALVLVHEWGHFIAAKRAGCRVEEFGFGFPPKIFSIKRGETVYSLNLLPIGGFVKIEGENMDEQVPGPTSFASKSATWRIIILAAGVTMNVIFAWLLLSVQAVIGSPVLVTEDNASVLADQQTYVLEISANSPAQQAGLQEYDRIVRINTVNNPAIEDIQQQAEASAGQPVEIEINRQGTSHMYHITPRTNPPEGEGAIGVSLAATGLQKSSIIAAPLTGIQRTGHMIVAIVDQFVLVVKKVASGGLTNDTLTGPIGIAVYTNEATRLGLPYLLEFAALISVNLALINIFPFPALDGGRIVFVLIERIIGRRLPHNIEHYANTAGFVLLIALMIVITFKDAQRFF